MSALICAICNQKGGVGKTTTVFNLADAAARCGARVLVIDLDPQGNLSSIISQQDSIEIDSVGVADALSDRTEVSLEETILPTIWPGVDLVPTVADNEALGAVRDELVVAGAGRERRLKRAVGAVTDKYDLVLIDCPPALDQLTINALTAADRAVIVTQAALFSVNGLSKLRNNIALIAESYNPELILEGTIVNQLEGQTIGGREQLEEIRDAVKVLGLPIPKATVIKDSSEASLSLHDYGSSRARNFAAFYKEIYLELAATKQKAGV